MTTPTLKDRGLAGMPMKNFPAGLKRKLADDAKRQESNLNDVAVAILATRFEIAYEPNGRRSSEIGSTTTVNLDLPIPLKRAIRQAAVDQDTTQRDVVIRTLDDHYGGR